MQKIKLSNSLITFSLIVTMPVLLAGCDAIRDLMGESESHSSSMNYYSDDTAHQNGYSSTGSSADSSASGSGGGSSSSDAMSAKKPATKSVNTPAVPLEAPSVGQ
ncbi:hypothetical protein [Legionella spiritensis]|uniref:Lipoprotein n=1 Tax=Legionella spiritensis TaxID=452 RepID=A0A0W0ZAV9_LEGSP|nr:hypothetical protein [Legionella spiritensis]KTD66284.1 hypothetical protein Lspi_0047 [Legionella spiritensis]SNV48470.1 Uncharacterised protein [Legionella spiritensis]VEG91495.1 Uncharacterised protein [Legionella spiritensis]